MHNYAQEWAFFQIGSVLLKSSKSENYLDRNVLQIYTPNYFGWFEIEMSPSEKTHTIIYLKQNGCHLVLSILVQF